MCARGAVEENFSVFRPNLIRGLNETAAHIFCATHMNIIAIDPGASGGIAVQRAGERAICFPMPDTEGDVIALLRQFPDSIVYLENLVKHMGAGIPASTMAVYASNWGFIKGAVQMQGSPLHLVTPQKWQKTLGLGTRERGTDKAAWKRKLRSEAQRLYPHLEITLKTADALLILAYSQAKQITLEGAQ